jgi:predicted unusual protein kinase regulating ubiquinone biosynthesis (AarF/ABC1/UbiB family)
VLFLEDKIGIIDFGLVYEIAPEFKNAFVSLVIDIFTLPAKDAAKSFLHCGILQPVENIRNNLWRISITI